VTDTLELIKTEDETENKSPILHLFCRTCMNSGHDKSFCGITLPTSGKTITNPSPPDKCAMCLEVRANIEPATCPKGHPMRGLLV
jgi:hypothetical protein